MADVLSGPYVEHYKSIDEINIDPTNMMDRSESGPEEQQDREALNEAQQLVFQARESSSAEEIVSLARRALEISEDCADAYVLLAETDAGSLEEARDYYERGVAAGERALGPEAFKEDAGHFWGLWKTRPYMRARQGLAQMLMLQADLPSAIEHLEDMLRLNPNDNQANRWMLADCYLLTGREHALEELIHEYEDDLSANWLYNRALLLYRLHGPGGDADAALDEALDYNPHVPDYLLERKEAPDEMPRYTGFGDENEAVAYVFMGEVTWQRPEGALDWLRRREKK